MFKRIAVCAALAASAVLLTACNAGGSAAPQETSTKAAADVQNVTGGGDTDPVDCGEVQVDGATHSLIADATDDGIVGCTEAFNVLDEYLTHGTSIEDTRLSDGWSCTTDDGETAGIGCVKDRDLAFHTEAA